MGNGNRTRNRRSHSPVLCQLSYSHRHADYTTLPARVEQTLLYAAVALGFGRLGGLAQPYSNTERDAPPVAVSRVGYRELSLEVHRSREIAVLLLYRFHADKLAPLLWCWILPLYYHMLLPAPSPSRHTPRPRSLPRCAGADSRTPSICGCRLRGHARACSSSRHRAGARKSFAGNGRVETNFAHRLLRELRVQPCGPSNQLWSTPVAAGHIWQRRFYDFVVFTEKKRVEKLRYMHRNPVKRGLVQMPAQWLWSSFRHHAFGERGPVLVNEARKAELYIRKIS